MSRLSLLFVLLAFHNGAIAFKYTKNTKVFSSIGLVGIEKNLQKTNKSPVKSIKSPDGDIIDCIDRHHQPAFDHPLLKNHKIQMVAPSRPKNDTASTTRGAWQLWHSVGHCPEGTVPIRRTNSMDNNSLTKSLHRYGKRQGKALVTPTVLDGEFVHEYAVVHTIYDRKIYGAKATINVWQPSLGDDREGSLSQIWLSSDARVNPSLNTVEAGITVNPSIFGDKKTRLFVFWTRDGYQTTGCYNFLCPGFVQISRKVAMGSYIDPISSYSGKQYGASILIWKDQKKPHWWLAYEDEVVGYWPSEIFTNMEHARMAEWGGEIFDIRMDGKHTSTQMGSGHFSEEGFGKASYFRNLETVDSDNRLIEVDSVHTIVTNSACYNIQTSSSKKWGRHFYYGGPGNNPNCP